MTEKTPNYETDTEAGDLVVGVNALVSVEGLDCKISGNFYANKEIVEHGCCWNTTICFKTSNGDGQYGRDERLLLECDSENVEYILTALNSKLNSTR